MPLHTVRPADDQHCAVQHLKGTLHLGGRVEALEFNVAPGVPFIGKPLKDIDLKDGLLVVGIVRRNGQAVIPSGDDVLAEGDDVVVVTTNTRLRSLRDIVK